MNVDLQYKIDRSALVGENRVVLQKLQLGERVESPGAMRLPLDLAIAILSDSEGRIDIALPVRGNVDSPEFSYGQVIWQALVTVVTKIVTSPFRALAGLFGGDAETLQTIAFEPGSDAVPPPERQKLQRVAEMLGKRTSLKLTVHGGFEVKADGEALRSLHVRQDLAQRLGVKVKPGEDPGPVAFDQAKTQRALEALLTERGGPKATEEYATDLRRAGAGRSRQRRSRFLRGPVPPAGRPRSAERRRGDGPRSAPGRGNRARAEGACGAGRGSGGGGGPAGRRAGGARRGAHAPGARRGRIVTLSHGSRARR